MRCPRCRHENRATASFCGECGGSLAVTARCPRCREANPPGHRFCDRCGATLHAGAPARAPIGTPAHLADKILDARSREGERKLVTVLFADVVHSMQLAEGVDAEDWHRVLDRFFQIAAASVHRFEGTVDHFTGDGIMALFGAPIAHEDHAVRGCHAALDLVAALGDYASTLAARGLAFAVRVGLNSGEVVVGRIGDDLHMEYTALGHTVGLAARMEQLAAPGTIWLTERTAALVDGFFALRDRGTPSMKGVSTPMRVYELVGPGALRTRLDAAQRRGLSRLVGREPELAQLWHALDAALAGDGRVVAVAGDAGVGKSRICHEFVARCRAQGVAVHEAHCPAHGAAVPLLPVRALVRSLFGIGADDAPDGVRERLAGLDAELLDALPLLFELLGVADAPAPAAGGAARRAALAAFVRRLVVVRSATDPLVLALDDAHWLDPASEEVLRALAAGVAGSRTLLLANARSEYELGWLADVPHQRLALRPLTPSASQTLLADLLGDDPSTREVAARIDERTRGNPFFIEEVVHALAACGSLAGRRGAYRLAAALETLVIPETVQALLAARIDRLGGEAKAVLQTAAVLGKQFDHGVLHEVAALDDRTLATALATLAEAQLVDTIEDGSPARYAFRHPLTQEVAYHALLGERRARVHAAVAAALERLRADRLGEYAELIAHHWDAAGLRYEAARWRRRAALRVASIQLGGRGRPPQAGPS